MNAGALVAGFIDKVYQRKERKDLPNRISHAPYKRGLA
jgi:hypothetical protein